MSVLSSKAAARSVAAVAVAAGLAVSLSAGAAQANPTAPDRLGVSRDRVILKAPHSAASTATLSLAGTAPRLVGGVAVRVLANYNCPSGTQGFLDVRLVEVTGNVAAQGGGSNTQPLTCDGAGHLMNVSVVLYNDHPFRVGKAFAQGFLYAFSDTDQATGATERAISIT